MAVHAVDIDRTLVVDKTADCFEQRALTRTIRTDDPDQFTAHHGEVDIV